MDATILILLFLLLSFVTPNAFIPLFSLLFSSTASCQQSSGTGMAELWPHLLGQVSQSFWFQSTLTELDHFAPTKSTRTSAQLLRFALATSSQKSAVRNTASLDPGHKMSSFRQFLTTWWAHENPQNRLVFLITEAVIFYSKKSIFFNLFVFKYKITTEYMVLRIYYRTFFVVTSLLISSNFLLREAHQQRILRTIARRMRKKSIRSKEEKATKKTTFRTMTMIRIQPHKNPKLNLARMLPITVLCLQHFRA